MVFAAPRRTATTRLMPTTQPTAPADPSSWLPEPGTRVQHYKGGLYLVTGLCTVEATLERAVLYQALEPRSRQTVWMRPVSDFLALVRPGAPRFSPVHVPSRKALEAAVSGTGLGSGVLVALGGLTQYRAPERRFHGEEHLFDMFEKAQAWGLELSVEQVLAILLHDEVCVPGAPAGQNEAASVARMRLLQRVIAWPVNWDLIAQIIEDTVTHAPTSPESVAVQALDLSSLAGTPQEFAVANELIWQENRHLIQGDSPRREFETRRLEFLEALMRPGPVFKGAFAWLEPALHRNVTALRERLVEAHLGPSPATQVS